MFRLKGYVSRQYLWTVRWGMVILQLCRWSFHTKKLCSRLYSIEIEFNSKKFEPPFGGLRGNVRSPSIARWKDRDVIDFLFVIIELFSLSLTLRHYIRGNLSKSAFLKGVSHFERKFQTEGVSSTNHCWCQKTRVIAVSCSIKISAMHCLVFVTKHACDRQTDGHHDSQDRASIAVSRGKN